LRARSISARTFASPESESIVWVMHNNYPQRAEPLKV
jgi:hypothetical protein